MSVLLATLALFASLPGTSVLHAVHSSVSPRMALFEQAASRSGVPLPVLVGVAWEQSFLSDHGGQPSIDGGYGLMGLSARTENDSLDAAARLVHSTAQRLRRDNALNILGGARLLVRYQRALGGGPLPGNVDDWAGAVVRFTGMRTAFTARLVTSDMYRALRHGFTTHGIDLPPLVNARPNLAWLRPLNLLTDKAGETSGPADYPGAVWQPADYNNYTDERRPASHPIYYIVIHDTESSCASAVSWFQNPAAQASAQYVVCRDGTVIQMVHNRDIAWHAGNYPINQESIGIEHEGYADGNYYTRAQYIASAALVSYLCDEYGIDPNRGVIFGHENVPHAQHVDPGPSWNWNYYMQQVRGDGTPYDTGMTNVAIVTGNATLYSCAETSCSPLGTANWGEQFYIKQHQPGWDEVYYDGQTAWLPSALTDSGSGFEVGIDTTTSVLDAASAKATVIGTVAAGQVYVSVSQDNGYWYIYYNHRYGFIPAKATEVINCLGMIPGVVTSVTPDCTLELDLWASILDPTTLLLMG